MSKKQVKATTISYAFVTLYNAAYYALRDAREAEDGRFFNCLTAMVFAAFSLEAYLNHVGPSDFPDWAKFERKKSPRQKLDLLVERRNYVPDFARRPFETFDRIFAFRKLIAHGRTQKVEIDEIQDGELGSQPLLPSTQWELDTTLENASSFVEDAASMLRQLHPVFGYHTDPFATEMRSSWEAKPLANDE